MPLSLSPEFWAICVVGFLIWWAMVDGFRRLEKVLINIQTSLEGLEHDSRLSPWVANQPEPDISELGDKRNR